MCLTWLLATAGLCTFRLLRNGHLAQRVLSNLLHVEGFQNPVVVVRAFDSVTKLAVFIRAVVPNVPRADVKVRAVVMATSLVETAANHRHAPQDDSANFFISESLEASHIANFGITLAVETVVEVAAGLPRAAPCNEVPADVEERAVLVLTFVRLVLPVLKAGTSIFVADRDKLDLPILLKGEEPVRVLQPFCSICMAEAFEKIPLLRHKSAQLGPAVELPQQEVEDFDPLIRTQLWDGSVGVAVLGLFLLVLVATFPLQLLHFTVSWLLSLCPSLCVISLLWFAMPISLV